MSETTEEGICWYTPNDAPFALAGFAWFARERIYRRLPRAPRHPLPPAVDDLANNTAGGQIRVQTDSTVLKVRVKLAGAAGMDHMPATGQCGFDLYVGPPTQQRYLSTTRLNPREDQYECQLLSAPDRALRNLTLNFPLYQGVQEVLVGLDADAKLLPPPPYADLRPIIIYGTSITQGGCASRPGMAYTNIISRRMNREIINLGFSGNGRGEPELAEVIADIPNPALLVMDYEANCAGVQHIQDTLPPFIRIFRAAHPDVPILVISRIPGSGIVLYDSSRHALAACRDAQRDIVDALSTEGLPGLHFRDGGNLLGDDYDECTVDGCHPTDLGFLRMADGIQPMLEALLSPATVG